ncbi:hypothetical protein T4E_772 [Trichinella pseudospiralis]|uniref:Uncharacterized protein n=1 Tax=Trichinella pseudospiralis TaxID=6337 RepID=A0A0V0YNM2_TRIPS|nr:hypothetical protein T4E_772 [Trichinella pseudospiralis]
MDCLLAGLLSRRFVKEKLFEHWDEQKANREQERHGTSVQMPFNRPNRETTICLTIDRPALAKGHLRPFAFFHSIYSLLFPDRRRWSKTNNNNINGGSCFPMGCVNLARAKVHARPKLTSTTKPPLNSCSTKSS